VEDEGCLIYDDGLLRHSATVLVELRGTHRKSRVSARRVAYALGHPHDRVRADEDVNLTCGKYESRPGGRGVCINPAHMVKVRLNAARGPLYGANL
jgi:hypothetical protein